MPRENMCLINFSQGALFILSSPCSFRLLSLQLLRRLIVCAVSPSSTTMAARSWSMKQSLPQAHARIGQQRLFPWLNLSPPLISHVSGLTTDHLAKPSQAATSSFFGPRALHRNKRFLPVTTCSCFSHCTDLHLPDAVFLSSIARMR